MTPVTKGPRLRLGEVREKSWDELLRCCAARKPRVVEFINPGRPVLLGHIGGQSSYVNHTAQPLRLDVTGRYISPPGPGRVTVSDLLWMTWAADCAANSLPPARLRTIWIDTVINDKTTDVA